MKTLLVAAVLLLSGCGSAHYVAPETAPYVKSFLAEAHAHGQYTEFFLSSIDFGDLSAEKVENGQTNGLCVNHDHVILSRKFWDEQDETGKMLLVYHELGHCLLGREHRTDSYDRGEICDRLDADGKCTDRVDYAKPKSIMYPSMPAQSVVKADADYQKALVDELFNGGK